MAATRRTARAQEDAPDRQLSRAEFVYKKLREGIRFGEFKPGQRLREAELATELKVSRTPIREAIRRLASDGLVEVAPSRGVMIIELDKQQVRELYALRAVLEGAAARFAAQHATTDEVREMRALLKLIEKAKKSSDIAHFNRLFHTAIGEAAHNRYLTQALSQLADSLALLPGTTFEAPGRTDEANQEHVAILDAIEARDAERAEDAARRHIQNASVARMWMMFDLR